MKIKHIGSDGRLFFLCPGCKTNHYINTTTWHFNGNFEQPTLSPSVLYRSGHYLPDTNGKDCWCSYREKHPEEIDEHTPQCFQCHSFVKDGMIQFLGDCTHALAGQTVPLEDL